jgi:hypothetical protein
MESEESDYNIESMANEFVERTESIAADFSQIIIVAIINKELLI